MLSSALRQVTRLFPQRQRLAPLAPLVADQTLVPLVQQSLQVRHRTWNSRRTRNRSTTFHSRSIRISGKSKRGLWDGKDRKTGHQISYSEIKTSRTFKPNVIQKAVYSYILGQMVQVNMTTSALRTMEKVGGFDNYILDPQRPFVAGQGKKYKKILHKKLKNQKWFERRRAELGDDWVEIDRSQKKAKATPDTEGEEAGIKM